MIVDKEPLGLDCDDCAESDEAETWGGVAMEFQSREGDECTYLCPHCGRVESIDEPWPEGWGSATIGTQKKFHYYRDGVALCGKWRLNSDHVNLLNFTKPRDPHSVMFTSGNDCTPCTKRMRADALLVGAS
jgi:hypothetical protein